MQHADEVAIVNGVLQTSEKSVADAMLTMDKVFCLSMDARLDEGTMADIIAAGFSRILIYDGNTRNIRGYLQVKRLIIISPEDKRVIRSLALRKPVIVSPHQSLLEVLNIFQQGQSHLAVVSHSPQLTTEAMRHGLTLEGAALPVGIITLEDIIEEIIQEEIYDESDHLSAYIERRARETLLKVSSTRRSAHSITPSPF
jgi:metal transporter CNNM